jgi:HAE1 family hydrophobic/amphiphilic exporter-1
VKITEFTLSRPRILFLALLLIFIAGLYSLSAISKEGDPDIQIPVAFVTVAYPGAGPEEIESQITDKVEDEMADLPNLDYITSTSSEGFALIQVIFNSDADLDFSMQKVRERADKVTPQLPTDAFEPEVIEFTLSDVPTMVMSYSAPLDPLTLRESAENLGDDLKQIPGVRDSTVYGGRQREIEVLLKPAKLSEYGVSINSVVSAIGAQHLQVPSGGVEIGPQRYLVRALGEYDDPSQLGQTRVPTAVDPLTGRPGQVKLEDIAEINDGPAEERSNYSRTDGEDAITIYLYRRTNSNVLETSEEIKARLGIPQKGLDAELPDGTSVYLSPSQVRTFYFARDNYSAEIPTVDNGKMTVRRSDIADQLAEVDIDPGRVITLPEGSQIQITSDDADMVNESLDTMSDNTFQGVLIVFLVLLVFMGFRTATLVATAIPLSILITIAILFFSGETLNSMNIAALILVVGMLVDNAIVVTQNIYRHLELGDNRHDAAISGSSEVAYPVFTSTLTTIFAFMPMLIISGVMGEYMAFIPITVSIALFCSYFVGIVLIPPIAARFLKLKRSVEQARCEGCTGVKLFSYKIRAFFDKIFNLKKLSNFYEKVINKSLNRRWVVLTSITIIFLVVVVGLPAMGLIKIDLFPPMDSDQVIIEVETPVGTPLEVTDAKVREVERLVEEHIPERERYVAVTGDSPGGTGRVNASQLFGLTSTYLGGVNVDLVESDERERTAKEIMEDLRPYLDQITGASILYGEVQGGPPTGSALNIKVYGDELDEQRRIANEIQTILEDIPGTRNVRDDITPGTPELQAVLDRDAANLYGFTAYDLGGSLRTLISGTKAGVFREGDEEYDITVKLPKSELTKVDDLEDLIITSMSGARTRVGTIADVKTAEGISQIRHYGNERAITIRGDLAAGVSSVDIVSQLQQRIADSVSLPAGYHIDYEGSIRFIEESFSDLGIAFNIAILLIFILLTLQFKSTAQPLAIMTTIVLSVIGAFIGLAVTGNAFTIIAFVGVIGLAGVAVNGAIVLVDFINARRAEGVPIREAIIEAGKIRLTPILLTAVTTIGGMFPLAVSDPQWAPLGYSFIFGLAFATLLTLIFVPTFYSWIEEKKVKIKAWFRRLGSKRA